MRFKQLKKYQFLLLLLLFGYHTATTQAVAAAIEADSTRIQLGDQLHLKLIVNAAQGTLIEFPLWTAQDTLPGGIEFSEVGGIDTVASGGELILERSFWIQIWNEGVIQFPATNVVYSANGTKQAAQTQPFSIQVGLPKSYVKEAEVDSIKIRGNKPIISEPWTFEDIAIYVYIAGGAIALIALIMLALRFFKREEKEVIVPIRPAHEVAFEKLDQLKKANLLEDSLLKEYQSELTFILREYLENRFKIPALESTTYELIPLLQAKEITKQHKSNINDVLQMADLVKFAKSEPPFDIHRSAFTKVLTFVQDTIPVETDVTEETEKEA